MEEDLISYEELKINSACNITEEAIKHINQSGSIFPLRAKALEEAEKATDYVKYVNGKLSMEVRIKGEIPGIGKITEGALSSYVDAHPEMVQARIKRAEALRYYDDVKGLVSTYIAKKELLTLINSDRINEFYSQPTA